MTWLATAQDGRVEGTEREKLLAKRAKLVKELEDMGLRPMGRSAAAQKYDLEDKMKVAKKITAIDKKLGRQV